MQALLRRISLTKIVFYPKNFYPLLLPSHNCIIILNVQFSRYIFELHQKLNEISLPLFASSGLQSVSLVLVEISGIEPLTSCLQGRRSPS